MNTRLCTLKESVELLGLSCDFLHRMVGAKEISHCRLGKKIKLIAAQIKRFLKNHTIEQGED